ncbi:MAG: ipdC [Chlamydiia bacterium]|nr:ipdC [Chlamydiia bacterium]
MVLTSSHKTIPKKLRDNKDYKERITIGKYLLKKFEKFPIHHLFCTSKTLYPRFTELVEENSEIELLESLSAFSFVNGYARRKRIGVLITTKAELLNESSSIYHAFSESVPLVTIVITKEPQHKKEEALNSFGFMTEAEELQLYFERLLKRCFLGFTVLDDADIAAKKIDRIIDSCIYYQKPVCFELPEKMIHAFIPPHQARQTALPPSDAESLRDAILHIKKLLQTAHKPYIVVGRDAQALQVSDYILQLAEKLEIPCFASATGKGVLDETHRLFAGSVATKESKKILDDADFALFIGLPTTGVSKCKHQVSIFDQEVIIDSISYPHILLHTIVEQLALSAFPPRKETFYIRKASSAFLTTAGLKLTLKNMIQCVTHFVEDDILLVANDPKILLEIAHFPLPKNSFLSGSFKTLAAGLGASFASLKRRPVILLSEQEFYSTMDALFTTLRKGLNPIIILLSESPCNSSALPDLLSAGRVFLANTQDGFETSFKKALSTHSEFTLIEVTI